MVKINLVKTRIGLYLYSISGTSKTDIEMYIHNLELKQQERGKGQFKALLKDIRNRANAQGCTSIRLQPLHQNIPGHCPSTKKLKAIYSRHGFTPVPPDHVYYSLRIR